GIGRRLSRAERLTPTPQSPCGYGESVPTAPYLSRRRLPLTRPAGTPPHAPIERPARPSHPQGARRTPEALAAPPGALGAPPPRNPPPGGRAQTANPHSFARMGDPFHARREAVSRT